MESYAYAVGKIRALERRLLPKSFLEKIAESGSLEAIAQDINERRATYDLIESLLEDPSLSAMLRLRDDIHNLKLLFKKKIDPSIPTPFSPIGAISPSLLERTIHTKTFREVPPYFREIVRKVILLFPANGSKQVEQFLEKEMWKLILDKSEEIKNIFLQEFFKLQVDFLNLKNFPEIFIAGGKLKKEFFGDKNLLEKKVLFLYPDLDLANLEKSSDDLLINYIKKAKIYSFGIEPLIGYLWAKESELKNIKLLILGKLNNIDSSVLKENLRETYV